MLYRLGSRLRTAATGVLIGACAAVGLGTLAHADTNIAGKKVVFVPIAMGISLTEGWARRMRQHADIYG